MLLEGCFLFFCRCILHIHDDASPYGCCCSCSFLVPLLLILFRRRCCCCCYCHRNDRRRWRWCCCAFDGGVGVGDCGGGLGVGGGYAAALSRLLLTRRAQSRLATEAKRLERRRQKVRASTTATNCDARRRMSFCCSPPSAPAVSHASKYFPIKECSRLVSYVEHLFCFLFFALLLSTAVSGLVCVAVALFLCEGGAASR